MSCKQVNSLWKEKVFPRLLIALLLTLLAIFLNSIPLLDFVTSLISQSSLVIVISYSLALIWLLFKKVLVSLLEKFQKASIVKVVVLAIFEDMLGILSYLLGFLVGALLIPDLRTLAVLGIIILVLPAIFLFIKAFCVIFRKLDEKMIHTGENSAS